MVDPKFRAAPLRRAQRSCYWSGFVFYLVSALCVVLGSVPGLLMAWCFPGYVHPTNVLPLLPAMLGALIVLPAMSRTTRIVALLRLNLIAGYCHLLAIVDFARGRSAEWVPTGAAGTGTSGPVERKVLRGRLFWGGLLEIVIWAGIVRGIALYGVGEFWVMGLVAGLTLWVYLPLVLPGHALRRAVTGPSR